VLKIYLDGSGKSTDPQAHYVTLAAVLASDSALVRLEAVWGKVLCEYHVPYSHMSEVLGGRGPFVGWDNNQKRAFVTGLLNGLGKLREDLIAASATVDLNEFKKVIGASKPVEAVCVDLCMSVAFHHPDFNQRRAEIVFDRGEQFMCWIERVWSRNKRNPTTWASYISSIVPGDMADVVPLQVADLLAWGANRRYNNPGTQDFWGFMHLFSFIHSKHYHKLVTESELRQHPGIFDGTARRY
jgi:hypothetical protein